MSNSLATLKATESETGEETLAASRCAAGTEASKGRKASGYCGSCNKLPNLMSRVYD